MIDQLDALAALRTAGTMGRAATILRVTQSAVSKRIAALEADVGARLIERHGRHVRLTPEGERILEHARPLLASLREVLHVRAPTRHAPVRIAATDSLLAAWLPATLRAALERLPSISIELHAHRGPTLLERVRSGDYALGFCPSIAGDKDLVVRELAREPMVIVPSRLEAPPRQDPLPVWAIETQSLTWEAIASRLPRLRRSLGFSLQVESRLESFTALVQVARAGFAHALVPIGVARQLGVPSDRLIRLGDLSRPVAAVARRTSFERPAVGALLAELAPLWASAVQ
ncbi:MAG TPA: LysR family transcriptional regulator [Polyangiales bacterium]|nr:LysR family transcriptional regulator [Polyangiales bacterium]